MTKNLTQRFTNPPLKETRAQGWCGKGACTCFSSTCAGHSCTTAPCQCQAARELGEAAVWPSLLYPTEGVSLSKGRRAVAAVGIGCWLEWLLAVWECDGVLWGPCSEGWSYLLDVVTGKRFAAKKLRGVNKTGERVVMNLLWEYLPSQMVCCVTKNSSM